MTADQEARPLRRKKSLRHRLIVSFTGLALLPLIVALVALFFMVRDDVSGVHGSQLAREAGRLSEQLQRELLRYRQTAAGQEVPAELQKFLESSQEGDGRGVVLFTAGGQRLAGDPKIPLPPLAESKAGWVTFGSGGESYFAGVAAVRAPGGTAPRDWLLAVVQPASQVFGHLYSVSRQVAFFTIVFVILVAALSWWMADQYMRPILEIRRGAEIISHINLDHRIKVDAGDEIEELALEFNLMAENLSKAYGELEERVRDATWTLHEERNRLATVLRTMADGVVVANEAAEIILMNPRARIILDRGFASGIGAPLSRIFPSDRLSFYLNRLRRRWDPARETVEEVVFPLRDGRLLKGSLSVVPGPGGERAGFLLVFRDLSAPTEEGGRYEETLREMPQLLRGPVGTSRSLVETLQRHREMPAEKQQAFLAAVAEEMDRLGVRVTAIEEAASAAQTSRWPAIPSNPRELLEESVVSVTGLAVEIEVDADPVPLVLVEPFSWVASLRCVLQWIGQKGAGRQAIGANLRVEEGTVVTTFRVEGPFAGNLAELESLEVSPAGEEPLLLGEAVRRNRGELWTRSAGDSLEVRLALMQATAVYETRRADGLIEGEPEFYNFDLFLPRPVFERQDLLQAELADLDYVVVDTETTGLQLSKGDKVISITGIRIRRGRVQNADIFNTLVNPGRADTSRISGNSPYRGSHGCWRSHHGRGLSAIRRVRGRLNSGGPQRGIRQEVSRHGRGRGGAPPDRQPDPRHPFSFLHPSPGRRRAQPRSHRRADGDHHRRAAHLPGRCPCHRPHFPGSSCAAAGAGRENPCRCQGLLRPALAPALAVIEILG